MKAERTIPKATELFQRLGSWDDVRRYYEALDKTIHDEATRLAGAWDEGKLEEKLEIARKMLAKDLPDELIT